MLFDFNSTTDISFDNVDDGSTLVGQTTLTTPYVLYGTSYTSVFVGSNGQVSFGSGTPTFSPFFPTTPPLVTAFWHDINLITGGTVYHRIINSGSELTDLADALRAVSGETCFQFMPTSAAVVTFDRVSAFGGTANVFNTFQVVLLTDGTTSYSVFLYNNMNWGSTGLIGFTNGTSFHTVQDEVLNLPTTSNVGVPGVYIFRTHSTSIQPGLENCTEGFSNMLFDFNSTADISFDNVDDGSTLVGQTTLTTPYVLYGTSYTSVFVGSNGQVSFGSGTSTFSPFFPTTPPLVTAFWRDINLIVGGTIYHRIINSGSELTDLSDALRAVPGGACLQFVPTSAAVVTFDQVSAFGGTASVFNTFQVILLTDGTTSYSIFLYNNMNWGTNALIGFTDGTSFHTVQDAVLNLPTTSNVGVPGVYIFRTHSTLIQPGLENCTGGPVCLAGSIRLVDGSVPTEGRVEVCANGEWGTVCDDLWNTADANVACRQLGYLDIGATALSFAFFGPGTGPIHLDNLLCTGVESRLIDCLHNGVGNENCDHFEDAGVRCQVCTNGDIRLVNGTNFTQGRVEVCANQQWGTVCDDLWDVNDARVACRQLGFSDQGAIPRGFAFFGQGSGDIVLDDLACTGNEERLIDCPFNPTDNCGHHEDAGVECVASSYEVLVTTDPPQAPYPAATWIGMICNVTSGAVHPVTFNWTFHCSLTPNGVLGRFDNKNDTDLGVVSVRTRSTPSTCHDTVICTVRDTFGTTVQGTWLLESVTGVGFFGLSGPIRNNTALQANTFGDIGVIDCHSSTMDTSVGQWLSSPDGSDITQDITDIFSVSFFDGLGFGYYSFNRLRLLPSSVPLTSADEGIFTCRIADENGLEQSLHIGMYPSNYPSTIHVASVQRHSLNPLTINCPTFGLPPTFPDWFSAPLQSFLSNGPFHQLEQVLTDRANSQYDNFITFSQNLNSLRGIYYCNPRSVITVPGGNNTLTEAIHFFGLYLPGDLNTITCNINPGQTIEWFDTEISAVIHTLPGLDFAFNDSIDERLYQCNVFSGGQLVRQTNITIIVNVPDSAYTLTASEVSGGPPMTGASYSFDCTATKTLNGLLNTPTTQWINPSGGVVSQGGGTTVTTSSNSASSEVIVAISPLRTSNAGQYTCQGSLSSPSLSTPLLKTATFNITLQIPPPSVTVAQATPGTFYAGTTRTLNCQAAINSAVDTAVSVTASWSRAGVPVTNGGRFTITPAMSTSSNLFLSTLTVTGLRETEDSAMFSCTAIASSSSPSITDSAPGTGSLQITVTALPLTASTSPSQARVLDTAPHNTLTLTCTADTVTSLAVPITFQWSRRLAQSSSLSILTDNGGSVVITTSGQSSELRTTVSMAGSFVYTCTASVDGSSSDSSADSTVTVDGQTLPLQPTNIIAMVTSFTTAMIQWRVPSTAYTPETYRVRFGTSQGLPVAGSDTMELVVSGTQNISEVDQQFSVNLASLSVDTTYYYQIVTTNSAGSVTSTTQSFDIEDIALIIFIEATGSTTAGEDLTLTCNVTEAEDITGTPVVTWLDPNGNEISTSGDFTVVSQLTGLTTILSLALSPLRVSHAGQYTCRAVLNEVSYTETVSHTVEVFRLSFQAEISSSSPDFQAASPLTLTCQAVSGAIAPFTFSWSSTCSGECFIDTQATSQVSSPALRAVDSGVHTCTVTDGVGNIGTAVITINTQGAGVYLVGSAGALANNSVVLTNSIGNINNIQCISGSTAPNVGRVLGPNGEELTSSLNLDPFDVSIGGANNPGHVEISLASGRVVTSPWTGVYTCLLPDENGVEQVLLFGIYTTGVLPSITGITLTANSIPTATTPENPAPLFLGLTLTCTSVGSAATSVSWRRDGVELLTEGGGGGAVVQVLRDGATSTYDNILQVVDLETSNGVYTCEVSNEFGTVRQNVTHNGLQVTRDPVQFIVGQTAALTCTSDLNDLTAIQWLNRDGAVLVSAQNSQSVALEFNPVNDSIHNLRYICRAVTAVGNQDQHERVIVEVDPASVTVLVTPPSSALPLSVEQFTLSCIVTVPAGLANAPSVKWFGAMDTVLENDTDNNIYITEDSSGSSIIRNLTFAPQILARNVDEVLMLVCMAAVSSPALQQEIERQAEWDLIVTSDPTPNICTIFMQLLLGEVNDCLQWRFEDAEDKISAIQQKLVADLQLLSRNFLQTEFVCSTLNPQLVLFRAQLVIPCDRSTLSSELEDYVASGRASVSIQGNRLEIISGCPVVIDTLDAPKDCDRERVNNPEGQSGGSTATIAGAAAGGGVLVVVVLIALVGVPIFCLRRRKKRRSHDISVNESYGMSNQASNPHYTGSLARNTNTITGANILVDNPYDLPPGHPPQPPPPNYFEYDGKLNRQDSDYIKMSSVARGAAAQLYDDTMARTKDIEEVYDEIPATKEDYDFYKNAAAVKAGNASANVYANC